MSEDIALPAWEPGSTVLQQSIITGKATTTCTGVLTIKAQGTRKEETLCPLQSEAKVNARPKESVSLTPSGLLSRPAVRVREAHGFSRGHRMVEEPSQLTGDEGDVIDASVRGKNGKQEVQTSEIRCLSHIMARVEAYHRTRFQVRLDVNCAHLLIPTAAGRVRCRIHSGSNCFPSSRIQITTTPPHSTAPL